MNSGDEGITVVGTRRDRSIGDPTGRPPSRGVRRGGLLAVGALIAAVPGGAAAQAVCTPGQGDAVIICGPSTDGGTVSQVFSPGSVIVLRQGSVGFPNDLPGSASDEETVARKGLAFFGLGGTPGGGTVSGFVVGFAGTLEQDGTELERGYSADRRGTALGIQVEGSGRSLVVALDYQTESQDYAGGSYAGDETSSGNPLPLPPASTDREDVGASLGASFDLGRGLTAFAGGRVGTIDLDTRRLTYDTISTDTFPDPDPEANIQDEILGQGSTQGRSMAVEAGMGYSRGLGVGVRGHFSASLAVAREELDGFTERSSDGEATFTFGDDQRTSVVSRLGAEVSRPFRIDRVLLVPSLRAAWLHEFADDSRAVDVRAAPTVIERPDFEPDVPIDFVIRTNDPDRDYFTLGAGLAALLPGGRASVVADYEAVVGHEFVEDHVVSLQLQVRF